MATTTNSKGGAAAPTAATPTRRANLMQERSRETRRRLVRAAMQLWNERGFETGIEETTAEEIAQAAGVTKGTFYFHFARKEEILLEMGYSTAARLNDEAARCLKSNAPFEESIRNVCATLARSVRSTPPAAVGRALAEFRRPRRGEPEIESSDPAFADAFEILFQRGQDEGLVTHQIPAAEMAQILEALLVDSVMEWADGRTKKLNDSLQRRATVVLAGLQADNPVWL